MEYDFKLPAEPHPGSCKFSGELLGEQLAELGSIYASALDDLEELSEGEETDANLLLLGQKCIESVTTSDWI